MWGGYRACISLGLGFGFSFSFSRRLVLALAVGEDRVRGGSAIWRSYDGNIGLGSGFGFGRLGLDIKLRLGVGRRLGLALNSFGSRMQFGFRIGLEP